MSEDNRMLKRPVSKARTTENGVDGLSRILVTIHCARRTCYVCSMPGRNSLESEALLEPHRIYAFDIDLVATANVFAAGHRIRLDVSSSNFPRIAPNPNTGERVNLHTHTCVARNLVYHDSVHASYILLPAVAVH